jgi:hypothetical protein
MFDYATIRAQWSTYPPIRMAYGEDETSYGRVLDATHVCIANLPLTGGLMLYDIVTLDRTGGQFPTVATLVQRYYAQQCCVAYVPETQRDDAAHCTAQYARLRAVCVAAGCAVEGLVHGIAMLNAPADVDVRVLLAPLGIMGEDVDIYQDEAEDAAAE